MCEVVEYTPHSYLLTQLFLLMLLVPADHFNVVAGINIIRGKGSSICPCSVIRGMYSLQITNIFVLFRCSKDYTTHTLRPVCSSKLITNYSAIRPRQKNKTTRSGSYTLLSSNHNNEPSRTVSRRSENS